MRFSKNTGYKMVHAPGGLGMRNSKWSPVDKNIHKAASNNDILKYNTTFLMSVEFISHMYLCLKVIEVEFVYTF